MRNLRRAQIAAGDIDGDGTDDLLGIWPSQGGVWVKYSSDGTWERLSSTADWIACGKMRGGAGSAWIKGFMNLLAPIEGCEEQTGWAAGAVTCEQPYPQRAASSFRRDKSVTHMRYRFKAFNPVDYFYIT